MVVQISPQRHAQLSDYAQRHGQDAAAALYEVLAAVLECERQDYLEAVEGICLGYEDMTAGRTQPAEEMFEELRVKHGLARLDFRASKAGSGRNSYLADEATSR